MTSRPGVSRRTVLATLFALAIATPFGTGAQDTSRADVDSRAGIDAAFGALAAGTAVVVMRHALAPGTGDPADFTRGDCGTQRNLSAEGREQARDIGVRLAGLLGGAGADVYSSAWCRCLETGRLLGLGAVEPLPALDSFFREREDASRRTAALREWIASRTGAASGSGRPAVLVTHQVNVTALTGVYPASGEMVVYGRATDSAPDAEPAVLARQTIE